MNENYLPVLLCVYCEQPNNIVSWERTDENGHKVGALCENCAMCCIHMCLPYSLDSTGDPWLHDWALKLMDAMFSDFYEFKERTGINGMRDGIFRKFEEELNKDLRQWGMRDAWLPHYLPGLMRMMARMMQSRGGYWQNGKWRKFNERD